MKARFLVLGILLGALALLTVPASTQQNTIIIGTTDGITTLDVADSYDYWTWHVFQNTSEGLVDFERGTAKVVPHLAESISVSPDGKEYTFKLRKGVKFWDGADFNADAVVFSLNRAKKLNGPNGAWEALMYDVVSVEKVDDYTVKIVTKGPDATFLSRLAGCACAFIMSPKSTPADKIASGQYAGTGRYKLARWTPMCRRSMSPSRSIGTRRSSPRRPELLPSSSPKGLRPSSLPPCAQGTLTSRSTRSTPKTS
jgi:peptide/nickel transport system substrate-binding protein